MIWVESTMTISHVYPFTTRRPSIIRISEMLAKSDRFRLRREREKVREQVIVPY